MNKFVLQSTNYFDRPLYGCGELQLSTGRVRSGHDFYRAMLAQSAVMRE